MKHTTHARARCDHATAITSDDLDRGSGVPCLLRQVLLEAVETIRESTAPSAEPTEIEVQTDVRTYRFRAESVSDRDDCAHPRRLLTWEVGQVYMYLGV